MGEDNSNSSFGSRGINPLQSAQTIPCNRLSTFAANAESPQREFEQQDQIVMGQLKPTLTLQDNNNNSKLSKKCPFKDDIGSDSDSVGDEEECESPTRIFKKGSLGQDLSLRSNLGTCPEDDSMNTPEFQFDEGSNQITKEQLRNKEQSIAQQITDMSIPESSQSCGSTLQGRKMHNLSVGTALNPFKQHTGLPLINIEQNEKFVSRKNPVEKLAEDEVTRQLTDKKLGQRDRQSHPGSLTNSTKDASSSSQPVTDPVQKLNVMQKMYSIDSADQQQCMLENNYKFTSDFDEGEDPFLCAPVDAPSPELIRVKSSSMHANTRPFLNLSLQSKTLPRLGGFGEQTESNRAPNHVKTIFRQLGGSDTLMIDETQEINRKTSKDSKETNGSPRSENGDQQQKQRQSIGGPHPDTPYPNHLFNQQKSSSELERVQQENA